MLGLSNCLNFTTKYLPSPKHSKPKPESLTHLGRFKDGFVKNMDLGSPSNALNFEQ
jgi:hypothetical protein